MTIAERFSPRNLIIFGFHPLKPDFNIFLKPMIQGLKQLEEGIPVTNLLNGKDTILTMKTFCTSADLPASKSFWKMMGHGGDCGCSMCKNAGKQISRGKFVRFVLFYFYM